MARLPESPDADRFFARVLSCMLECPRCGWLDSFRWQRLARGKWKRVHSNKPEDKPPGWDPTTATWRCTQCGLACTLGLLAWPVETGGARQTRPRDQVPSERELAQIRARGNGFWMPAARAVPRHRPEDTNITAKCTCLPPDRSREWAAWTGEPAEEDRDTECLIHGDLVRHRANRGEQP